MTAVIEVPKRIQSRRSKGWRLPEGAVYVGRPTKWGNPFRFEHVTGLKRVPGAIDPAAEWEYEGRISADGANHAYHHPDGRVTHCTVYHMTRAEIVETFWRALTGNSTPSMVSACPSGRWLNCTVDDVRRELAGKDLSCWCAPKHPCHADVLLAIANDLPWSPG